MGWGSSRTDLKRDDTSRTNFGGLDLGLKGIWPWPRRCCLEHIPAPEGGIGSVEAGKDL